MKKLLFTTVLLITTMLSFGQAPESLIHSSTSYVDDYAHIYTDEQAHNLDATIRAFKAAQFSIVTINSLNGLEPSEYGVKLFNLRGVGSHSNNGVQILICPSAHKFWTTTGGGVQGQLTDLQAAKLFREYAQPKFRQNDFYGGTSDVLNQYINLLAPASTELLTAQTTAEKEHNTKVSQETWYSVGYFFLFLVVIGLLIIGVIKIRNARQRDVNEKLRVGDKFNVCVGGINKIADILKDDTSTEASSLINSLNNFNLITDRFDINITKAQMLTYIDNYNKFSSENKELINQYNKNQIILSESKTALSKYTEEWKQSLVIKVNNLVTSLSKMYFDKNDYTNDIKQLNIVIQRLIDVTVNLKTALDTKNITSLSGLMVNVNGAENEFESILKKLTDIVNTDESLCSKARGAKQYLTTQLDNLEAYTRRTGVSQQAAVNTKNKCDILRRRLNEFDGLEIVLMYRLLNTLTPMLNTCTDAKHESDVYEAEQQRLRDIEARRLQAIRDEENRKQQAIRDEENRKRRIREQEEDDARSAAAAAYSYNNNSNNSLSSDDSDDSLFGGGSSDGGGSGGDW